MVINKDALSLLFVYSFCFELNSTTTKLSIEVDDILTRAGFPSLGDIPILNDKVFKGQRVSIREHPYIASIRRNYAHYLTGTILTRNLVVTVAHPLIDVPIYELGVVVGQNYADRGTIINTVILVIIHEHFDRFTLQSDIALLRLFERIVFKGSVKSIPLQKSGTELDGARAFITGWARCDNTGSELCLPRSSRYNKEETMDPMLRSVSFKINFPNYYCDAYLRNNIKFYESMVCIGPSKEETPLCPCLAVPGAPLIVGGRLAAISSWGFGCGYDFDLPLVFTNIATNVAWILGHNAKQRQINSKDITLLYRATKAYFLLKWINETRVIPPNFTLKSKRFMIPLDIDKKLSATPDIVYDIRDYIKDGFYREFKMYLYDEFRKRNKKIEQLKQLKPNIHTKPFLSKEVIKDIQFK